MKGGKKHSVYQEVYDLVRLIPKGKVASYGQIASLVEGCTARMVGYAMPMLPEGSDVPWQRVVNSQGKISPRSGGDGEFLQRELLEKEGVDFRPSGRIDMVQHSWEGPDLLI